MNTDIHTHMYICASLNRCRFGSYCNVDIIESRRKDEILTEW